MSTKTQNRRPIPHAPGSEYRTLYGSADPLMVAALWSLPAWAAAAERLLALQALPPFDPGAGADELAESLADALATGEGITREDLLDRARAAVAQDDAARLANAALTRAATQLVGELDAVVHKSWPALFGALDRELNNLVREARALQHLDELADAEAAIAADRAADFRVWQDICRRHASVRTRQMTLQRLAGTNADQSVTRFVEAPFFKSPEALWRSWPQWHGQEGAAWVGDPFTGGGRLLSPPWPTDSRGVITYGVAGSEEFLRWALASDATLWVPSPAQLTQEARRLAKTLEPQDSPAAPVRRKGARSSVPGRSPAEFAELEAQGLL